MAVRPCKMVTGDQLKSVLASPVFSELVAKDMDEISGMLECCTAEAGDSLRRVGDESSSLYIVARGCIKLVDPTRREVVGMLTEGQVFGLLSILFPGAAYIEAYADEPTVCVVLDAGNLRMLEVSNPALAVRILRGIRASISNSIRPILPILARISV
ncbi:MAG: cyclic nucleotide-binding domain-containing protein [Bradymonadales bacterium]|nr:cyclic nucleotide-binding domain-containing protein [Bradymonadales bacterium]